jgi:ribosome-binding protein aMBF1 (putative translation factor)
MILCDLCGEARECSQKEVEGKEFDICADCWRPLAEKLKGKGRLKRSRETVFLPPAAAPEREPEGPEPLPERPPKIFGGADRTN